MAKQIGAHHVKPLASKALNVLADFLSINRGVFPSTLIFTTL